MKPEDIFDYIPMRPKPTEEKLLIDSVHDRSEWMPFLQRMSQPGLLTSEIQNAFHTKWIECGHFIRAKLDDDKALTQLLALCMPKYEGSGLIVFRGENEHRFNSGKIGFCWTENRESAEIFARGLNACRGQGFLLRAYAPPESIFSGPNDHSRYLDEHEVTLNPQLLDDIQIITTYPKSH
ncbi:hypothetical protein RJE46_14080 [Cedecea neteri]|uniref:hypothetical protein n=1 Tax=Cedecea neteri TaxID=158822 RepID=UPI0028935EAD|nr:hypothetical protein [Cedecea neteri]WNJ77762.1 hypothetical protein RJE46_14080 [Cedecea neteri]